MYVVLQISWGTVLPERGCNGITESVLKQQIMFQLDHGGQFNCWEKISDSRQVNDKYYHI